MLSLTSEQSKLAHAIASVRIEGDLSNFVSAIQVAQVTSTL